MRSYDAWEQAVVTARQEQGSWDWTLAALAVEGAALGQTPKQMAGPFGRSASRVRRLLQVWRAFPAAEDRPEGLAFDHYVEAVTTEAPADWIAVAADEHWSVRQLRDAIKVAQAADPSQVQQDRLEGAWRGFCNAAEAAGAERCRAFAPTVARWLEDHRGEGGTPR